LGDPNTMRVSGFDGHRRKVLMTPLKVWRSSCDPVLGFHGPQALECDVGLDGFPLIPSRPLVS